MDKDPVMMRYRFDTFEQLGRHVHLIDGTALIFLPGREVDGRVLLELEVRERAQRTAVRGEVVSRTERGAWLQLADARLAHRLRQGGFEVRREGRLSADTVVSLRGSGGDRVLGQLVDVGAGGMRVRGAGRLIEGETYEVRLMNAPRGMPAELGRAQVVRSETPEAGMRFVPPTSPQVPRYLRILLDAWMQAPQLEHAPGCCVGSVLEPPPPRLRKPSAPL